MTEHSLTRHTVWITARQLGGFLAVPDPATGLVIFVHGSGSSRYSPRNNWVADHLNEAGFATLLFDLLTDAESRDRANVFNIGLLATRLTEATEWAWKQEALAHLPLGYFGASTGAGAALTAAAGQGGRVAAVVSRGGRPDLAPPEALARVTAPTLLIVGSRDEPVIALNQQAMAFMRCETALEIVPGATHLFEEPGTLKRAADLAADWFGHCFAGASLADKPAA